MPKSDIEKFCIERVGGFIGTCNELCKCLTGMREAMELSKKLIDEESPPTSHVNEFDRLADRFLAALESVRPSQTTPVLIKPETTTNPPAQQLSAVEIETGKSSPATQLSEDRQNLIEYLRQRANSDQP